MDLTAAMETYLWVHGLSTIGAIIVFLVRTEHRITVVETKLGLLKESHDHLTGHGQVGH